MSGTTSNGEVVKVSTANNVTQKETAAQRKRRQLDIARDHELARRSAQWQGLESLLDIMDPDARGRVYNRARSGVRTIVSQASSAERILPGVYESRVKYYYDWHMKYSMSLVCIIFILSVHLWGPLCARAALAIRSWSASSSS